MIPRLGNPGEPPWNELDDGIREVVRWLWRAGFLPTDSGDGRRRGVKAEMDGALDFPHVFMVCAPDDLRSEGDRLARAVVARGLGGDGVSIEAVYFPLGEVAILELFGVDDDMLARTPETMPTPATTTPTTIQIPPPFLDPVVRGMGAVIDVDRLRRMAHETTDVTDHERELRVALQDALALAGLYRSGNAEIRSPDGAWRPLAPAAFHAVDDEKDKPR